jgi:putative SOS response-associated peptidase YedK
MCGRFSLTSRLDQLLPRLQGPLPEGLLERYTARPQVFPGEPVLLQRQEHGRLEVAFALWGLLPHWWQPGSGGGRPLRRPINARAETVAEKPFFRAAWRHRRALIPADGFYEWQTRRDAAGRPWKRRWLLRRRDRAPFWLGGLWDRWIGADGSELDTCVILTTRPNDLLARLHDRMPVLIADGLEEPWLAAADGAALRALEPLLEPWDGAAWEALEPDGPAPPAGSDEP